MALYTSRCSECGERFSYIQKIADRNNTPVCHGKPTEKLIDAPQIGAMAFAGSKGFLAEATDTPQWLESGADVKRYMKQNDLMSTTEAAQEARIKREAREVEVDRKLDQAIEQAVQVHGI